MRQTLRAATIPHFRLQMLAATILLALCTLAHADSETTDTYNSKETSAVARSQNAANQGLDLSLSGGQAVTIHSTQDTSSSNVAHAGVKKSNAYHDSYTEQDDPQPGFSALSESSDESGGDAGNTNTTSETNRKRTSATASSVNTLSNETTISITNPTTVVDNSPQQFQNVLDQADAFTLQHFDKASRQTWGVAAGAAALANLPQSPYPGRSMMGMSFGTSNGETAIAAGISHFMDNDQVMFKAGASYKSQGSWSGGIGVGYILP